MNPTVILTGANAGIGLAASHELARRGATVVMACRNEERGRRAVDQVREATGHDAVHLIQVDMSSLTSIRAFARTVHDRFDTVQAVIHNAALFDISQREVEHTDDGLERVWATNFVGPWLLTRLLRPLLQRAQPGRVIDISSKGLMAYPFLRVDPVDAAKGERYSPERAYYQSKLAGLMHSQHLARTADPQSLVAHAVWVPAVKVALDRLPPMSACKRSIYLMKRRFALEPQQMAPVYADLALEPAWEACTGTLVSHDLKRVRLPAAARDPDAGEALEAAMQAWLASRGEDDL